MKLYRYIISLLTIFSILSFTGCSQKKFELDDINSDVTLQDMAYILEDYINKVDANTKADEDNKKEIAFLRQQLINNNHKISTNSKEIDILNIKVQNLKQETKESIITYIKSHNILEDKTQLSPKTISLDTQDIILDDYVSEPLIETKLNNTFIKSKINQNTTYKLARVYVPQGVVVKQYPKRESKTIKHYPQNSILKIKSCDRFGWCRLYGERGYVTQFLLNFKRLKP